MYHVTFDGVMTDEHGYAAVGGQSDALKQHLATTYEATPDLTAAVKLGVEALAAVQNVELAAPADRSGRPRPDAAAPDVPSLAGTRTWKPRSADQRPTARCRRADNA